MTLKKDKMPFQTLDNHRSIVMRTYYEKAFAVPLALKLGNSFVSASHWLLTQMALLR